MDQKAKEYVDLWEEFWGFSLTHVSSGANFPWLNIFSEAPVCENKEDA